MKAGDLRGSKKPEEYTAEDEIIFNTDFSDSESYERFLRTVEGEHLEGYDDKLGNMTIGVGRNLGKVSKFKIKPKITTEQLNNFLDEDLRTARNNMRAEVKNFDDLDPAVQNILTDLSFNLGASKFSKGFPNAKAAIEAGDLRGFRDNMMFKDPKTREPSKWSQQTGRRSRAIDAALLNLIKNEEARQIKMQQEAEAYRGVPLREEYLEQPQQVMGMGELK